MREYLGHGGLYDEVEGWTGGYGLTGRGLEVERQEFLVAQLLGGRTLEVVVDEVDAVHLAIHKALHELLGELGSGLIGRMVEHGAIVMLGRKSLLAHGIGSLAAYGINCRHLYSLLTISLDLVGERLDDVGIVGSTKRGVRGEEHKGHLLHGT